MRQRLVSIAHVAFQCLVALVVCSLQLMPLLLERTSHHPMKAIVSPVLSSSMTTTKASRPLRVVALYPHSTTDFTQGLAFDKHNTLYEATGLHGYSTLTRYALDTHNKTRTILAQTRLDGRFFGEGVAVLNERVYWLTWKTRRCFVYDENLTRTIDTFTYESDGWGLTTDGKENLIRSDGSDTLYVHDKIGRTLEKKKVYAVQANGEKIPIDKLNELEYIKGKIWANVWQTEQIAVIDPETGRVERWISTADEMYKRKGSDDVFNGIAYDANDKLYVTGKWWPHLYEVEMPEE